MRATWLVLLVLLGPTLAAAQPAPTTDLIVLLRAPMPLPDGAIRLSVLDGFVLLDAPPGLADALAARPEVERVEIGAPIKLAALATGPAPALSSRLIRADDASLGATGAGVTVAVVDTGIDGAHPDLAGRVKANLRVVNGAFLDAPGDQVGHGTHVAGIVAGADATSGGWHGVAPGAQLVGIDLSSHFTTATALLAYDWLFLHHEQERIGVVVNAWGRIGDGRDPFDPQDAEIRAIDKLVESGVVVVFSAANHGPGPGTLSLEAQDPQVITVGATDAIGQVVDYSSRGPVATRGETWVKPDVVAPGDAILSLKSEQAAPDPSDPDAFHRVMSGTSQAAPHVAGLAALMLEANASQTPAQIRARLVASAIDVGPPGPDDASGYGLVDAPDALRLARGLPTLRDHPLFTGGDDRYHGAASLSAPEGSPLSRILRPSDVSWQMPFAVLPGATALDVRLAASPNLPLTLTLLREGRAQATWTGASEIHGRLDAPEPGLWTLEASGPASAATTLDADLAVHLKPTSQPPDASYRPPDPPRFGQSDGIAGSAATLIADHGFQAILVGVGILGALVALGPRRKAPGEEPPRAEPPPAAAEPPDAPAFES